MIQEKGIYEQCYTSFSLIPWILLQGHLDTYRFCDEVWTFLIKDINFKLDNSSNIHADRVKIVSCNSKKPGEV